MNRTKKIEAAWKEQHISIIKKWLDFNVFATPHRLEIHLRTTDQKLAFSEFASRKNLQYSGVSRQGQTTVLVDK